MHDEFGLREAYELLKWGVTGLLAVMWGWVRSENKRLGERLSDLERDQADLREEIPKEYVAKSDLQQAVQRQSEETRAIRSEMSQLRTQIIDQMTKLRDDLVTAIVRMLGNAQGKD